MQHYLVTLNFVLITFFATTVKSQAVYDVFKNKQVEYNNKYEEILSDQQFFSTKVSVDYFALKDSNMYKLKRLNHQIKNLSTSAITKEAAYLALYTEVKKRLAIYDELLYSRNNTQYEEEEKRLPELTDITSRPVSLVFNIITFCISYKFVMNTRSYHDKLISKLLIITLPI